MKAKCDNMEKGTSYIQGLNEYIRQGEPLQRERSEAWKAAIGLQQVDRLQESRGRFF